MTVHESLPPAERGLTLLDDGLSNFDHEVPDGLADKLRAGGCYCDYAAWNFHAKVWFEDGMFHAYVRRYRSHAGTRSAETLEDLMRKCSDEWGYE